MSIPKSVPSAHLHFIARISMTITSSPRRWRLTGHLIRAGARYISTWLVNAVVLILVHRFDYFLVIHRLYRTTSQICTTYTAKLMPAPGSRPKSKCTWPAVNSDTSRSEWGIHYLHLIAIVLSAHHFFFWIQSRCQWNRKARMVSRHLCRYICTCSCQEGTKQIPVWFSVPDMYGMRSGYPRCPWIQGEGGIWSCLATGTHTRSFPLTCLSYGRRHSGTDRRGQWVGRSILKVCLECTNS